MKYTKEELSIIRAVNYSHQAYEKLKKYAIDNKMTLGEAYVYLSRNNKLNEIPESTNNTITRACFTCGIVKPLTAYRPNRRKYQIKKYEGVSINCTECVIEFAMKEMSCVQFNFDTGKYERINFETKEEIINFYKL